MQVKILLKKEYNKASTLTCVREDGSMTYSKLQIDFEIHDIAHYIVEKQLQLKNAFYGMLARGYEINDFMLPKEKRPEALKSENLPPEALATEHLVNLLTLNFMQLDDEMDISIILKEILEENGLAFPIEVKQTKIISMQEELAVLMLKWNELPNTETLEMILEI